MQEELDGEVPVGYSSTFFGGKESGQKENRRHDDTRRKIFTRELKFPVALRIHGRILRPLVQFSTPRS
jgi:hypothetical protein